MPEFFSGCHERVNTKSHYVIIKVTMFASSFGWTRFGCWPVGHITTNDFLLIILDFLQLFPPSYYMAT